MTNLNALNRAPQQHAENRLSSQLSDANIHHRIEPRAERAPEREYAAPTYGGPSRDAVNSVVDNVVSDLCEKINTLRLTLDDVEKQVLRSAAEAKGRLQDHITVCVKVNDEITHMAEVIAEIQNTSLPVRT